MSSLTRGPLPAGIYWRRRALVLVLLLVLLVLALRALGAGGGDAPGAASTVAQDTSASDLPSVGPTMAAEDQAEVDARVAEEQEARAEVRAERQAERRAEQEAREAAAVPLAEPEGACSDADVVVSPVVEGAVAGGEVTVLLNLRTVATPACTWTVGPAHLTVKIASGEDDIWSSQQCPAQVSRSTVTVRAESTSTTAVTWDAKRSAKDCPSTTPYAEPGYYHAVASSLGGEPNDVQFELVDPRDLVAEQQAAEEAEQEAEQQAADEAEQQSEQEEREERERDRSQDEGRRG